MPETANPNLLHRLVGDWRGQEVIQPSQWGAGGPALARVTCREELGGKVFAQDYVAERDGKIWLQAHAIYCQGADAHHYSLFWFDSLGFVPQEPSEGKWDGRTLSFVRVSPRGRSRHVYTFSSDDTYEMRLESSFGGGATWTLVMEGLYERAKP